jgi:hypothetical protein
LIRLLHRFRVPLLILSVVLILIADVDLLLRALAVGIPAFILSRRALRAYGLTFRTMFRRSARDY